MKAILFAIVLAPSIAAASHHCHETSTIVGYERCSRFGGWSWGATMWWEAGAAMLRYSPKLIDATSSVPNADGTYTQYRVTAAPGDPRELTATGGRLRSQMGLGRHFYLGGEATIAPVTSGPHLVANVSARGTTTMMDTGTGGTIFQNFMFVGYHTR